MAMLCGCEKAPETHVSVRECASMPGGGRASACVAVLDNKAYVFAGRGKGDNYLNDLWVYDATADTWTDLGATPLKKRVNASMVAHDGKLYMGMGYAAGHAYQDSAYLKDWWSYSPETGMWTRLADYPNANTVACTSFVLNEAIYALYGCGHIQTRQVCIYSPLANSWRILPDNPHRPRLRFGERAVLHQGLLYFGTGYCTDGSMRDWYEADVETDTWTARKAIPGKGREFAACTNTKDYIYLFGGRFFAGELSGGEVMNTFMRYSPEKDEWSWCGTMPVRMENGIAFTINGKVYFGLGENENKQVLNTLYCIDE